MNFHIHRKGIFTLTLAMMTLTVSSAGTAAETGMDNDKTAGEKRIYVNPTGDEYPIMAYHAFKEPLINPENFRVLRDCGFNLANGWVVDTTKVSLSLKYAADADVRLLVNIPGTRDASKLKELVGLYDRYPATAGYYLYDEPTAAKFGRMAQLIAGVVDVSPRQIAYVNLLPNYATPEQLKASSYEEYLELFVQEADPQFISYDNYCIQTDADGFNVLRDDYFENIETVRRVADRHGLPFWTFILSTAHFSYPVPDEGQMLFQGFVGLAYGSKAIQYYGYATDAVCDGKPLNTAPLDQNGNRRPLWYKIRQVNRQIAAIGKILLGCHVKEVLHTGASIPKGTRKLDRSNIPYPFTGIVSGSAGVVVSHLKGNGADYLLLVNKDFERRQKVRIEKTAEVRRIYADGQSRIDNSRNVTLPPGGWCLYTW